MRHFLPPYTLVWLAAKMASKGLVVYSTTIRLIQCFMFIKARRFSKTFSYTAFSPPPLLEAKDSSQLSLQLVILLSYVGASFAPKDLASMCAKVAPLVKVY